MKFIVTGSKGYIGSHMTHMLREMNHKVHELKSDLRSCTDLEDELSGVVADAVFHFAGLIQVGESVKHIKKYYETNVMGTLNLLNVITKYNVSEKVIFSSSAAAAEPNNPYGSTKKIGEMLLDDFNRSHNMKYVALRYYNASGANDEADLYENHDPETHIIPLILKAGIKQDAYFTIFGNDYNTPDGTCIRDYIHVQDLVDAHFKAFKYLETNEKGIFDLGTGKGISNLELITRIKTLTKLPVVYRFGDRRHGDPATLVADVKNTYEQLGWKSTRTIDEIIISAYMSLKDRL